MSKLHTRILVDADVVAFRAASVAEPEVIEWEPGVPTEVDTDVSKAYDAADHLVSQITSEVYGDIIMVGSDVANFRKALNPSYKSNRKGRTLPRYLADVHAHLASNFRYESWTNLEADDVIGIMSNPEYYSAETIIVSPDKDFFTLPGRSIWRIWTKEESLGIQTVSDADANLRLFEQILTGDAVDGYKGINRVGPKTAKKWLAEWTDHWVESSGSDVYDDGFYQFLWHCVRCAYARAGVPDEAFTNAWMARILRGPDEYREEDGWVRIWEPTMGVG